MTFDAYDRIEKLIQSTQFPTSAFEDFISNIQAKQQGILDTFQFQQTEAVRDLVSTAADNMLETTERMEQLSTLIQIQTLQSRAAQDALEVGKRLIDSFQDPFADAARDALLQTSELENIISRH